METEIIIALITSIVAAVIALFSGLFSFLSSRKSTKVAANKAYIEFLNLKINKLEKALISFYSEYNKSPNNTIEDDVAIQLKNKLDTCHKHLNIYSYLVSFGEENCNKLKDDCERIVLSITSHHLDKYSDKLKLKDEYRKSIIPTNEIATSIVELINNFEKLLDSEIKQTRKELESLTKNFK